MGNTFTVGARSTRIRGRPAEEEGVDTMKRWKLLALAVVTVAGVAVLVASSVGLAAPAHTSKGVTLVWWNNANQGPGKALWAQVVKEFQKSHPGVAIKNVPLQNEPRSTFPALTYDGDRGVELLFGGTQNFAGGCCGLNTLWQVAQDKYDVLAQSNDLRTYGVPLSAFDSDRQRLVVLQDAPNETLSGIRKRPQARRRLGPRRSTWRRSTTTRAPIAAMPAMKRSA